MDSNPHCKAIYYDFPRMKNLFIISEHMKKYFELFVNISLIISIFAISPGLLLNGDKVANDSINYWF